MPAPRLDRRIPIACTSWTAECKIHPDESPSPTPTPEPQHEAPAIPAVTLNDLAHFTPKDPTLTLEPDGIAILGRPFNATVAANTHTLTGHLFDQPVRVTFTPDHYTIDYGDHTPSVTTTTGGTSWKQAGDDQFTATDTSHIYRHREAVTVTATVAYSASVTFPSAGITQHVDGTVTREVTGKVRVYEARTALVAHDCIQDPDGPGC